VVEIAKRKRRTRRSLNLGFGWGKGRIPSPESPDDAPLVDEQHAFSTRALIEATTPPEKLRMAKASLRSRPR
jgi:hypothetical protein